MCRPARRDRSSRAGLSCAPTPPSTFSRRSRSLGRIGCSTTDSDESRGARRRQPLDAAGRTGHVAAPARRTLVARARLPLGAGLSLRHPARRHPFGAPCTRARRLRLGRPRNAGRGLTRGVLLAPAWYRATGLGPAGVDSRRRCRRGRCRHRRLCARFQGRPAEPLRRLGDLGAQRPCPVRLRLGRPHRLRRLGLSLREPRLPVVAALARSDRLSLVFCVGVAASGRWLLANERWTLAVATFCFAGALLMKNEGSLFVLAVFAALLVVAQRRWRALAVAAAVDVVLLLPWRIYVHVHHLRDINYSF